MHSVQKTSKSDCVCVCSRYFLLYSFFSAFEYLPAPRVPFWLVCTDYRSETLADDNLRFRPPRYRKARIDPYSAPRNISKSILIVFAPLLLIFSALVVSWEYVYICYQYVYICSHFSNIQAEWFSKCCDHRILTTWPDPQRGGSTVKPLRIKLQQLAITDRSREPIPICTIAQSSTELQYPA